MQSLSDLRERHRGPVIEIEDRGYDEARATFNGMIERHPELIVRPIDVADVVTAVRFAGEADLPVAIRGGGHGVAGHCVGDGSLVVDLRLMREVVVDPNRGPQPAAAVRSGRISTQRVNGTVSPPPAERSATPESPV